MKNNFFAARPDERNTDVLGREPKRWTFEVAVQHTHGTTQHRPVELFEQDERNALLALPPRRPELVIWHEANYIAIVTWCFVERCTPSRGHRWTRCSGSCRSLLRATLLR